MGDSKKEENQGLIVRDGNGKIINLPKGGDKMEPASKQVDVKDEIKLGHVWNLHGILRDEHGKIIDEQWSSNQVQTAMLARVMDGICDRGDSVPSDMGIGTGTGQGVGANTLAAEDDRQNLDSGTPSHSANVATFHRLFGAGEGSGIITEAGIFDDPSAGTMLLYDDTINFTKGVLATLELTWTLTAT